MQAALAKHGAVFLPNRDKPYYINDPIVLKSGQRLSADSKTEIRLVPNTSTCMVRNEHPIDGSDRPLPADAKPDTQILIEGGIWTTLATGLTSGGLYQYNGNGLAWSTRQKTGIPPAIHCHGVIFLSNVRGVAVRNLVVRQSGSYALHMSNCREFLVEGVIFGFLNRIRG
jgi:polygalacturonase